ncbi:thiamine pyrophosphate-binding protein [Streptomyces bambusae]|uniref:thiamine pyrophosphate-binding protein n=1 Tax=Streptomyces bambusae TaxID=1550616 RepID=UPI001CFDE634|nr:thiamine pyrophosphate-binding protein [Streptomyces bambusae]MCB5166103.1 thiamine pyrophosphate-binding protein [Streptomyces bambusae]
MTNATTPTETPTGTPAAGTATSATATSATATGGTPTAAGAWRVAASVLAAAGVRTVFGLPGDDMYSLEAAHAAGIRFVLCRDQRNAVFAATGWAIQSGQTGVAVVGKGPAVTNTVTGLLEAAASAVPVLLLSGGTGAQHRGSGAFQELDQLAVVAPLVKYAARVDHPDRLVPTLQRALLVARHERGPVYVELPEHLLAEAAAAVGAGSRGAALAETPYEIVARPDGEAVRVLRAARRPVLLVGGGMRHENGGREVEALAERLGAAVFATASGRGAVDETSPLFCGLAGLYTQEQAARLWQETDCVVALGSRLEETATFQWPAALGREVPVVQVNVAAADFATAFEGPKVLAPAGATVRSWLAHLPEEPAGTAWTAEVHAVHTALHTALGEWTAELAGSPDLHIAEVLRALDAELPADRILVQENGLQDMWSYKYPLHTCAGGAGSVVPSEQTSLGFGAAAALGVKLAAPGRPVVAFVGDGAFAMAGVDLPTAVEYSGGLLYVVLRNGGYGWLQVQLDQRETPVGDHAFTDPEAVRTPAPELPGLHQVTVRDKESLADDVARAWRKAAAGEVVVLNVPVRLTDAMFGADVAGGDFPQLGGTGDE